MRPYNPLGDYLEMTFWRANFLLLAPMYMGTILLMLRKGARLYSGYLLMGLGIAVIHCVIFGLSAYSKYAEIGTAINRVLLQTLPVFILTVTAVWHFTSEHSRAEKAAAMRNAGLRFAAGPFCGHCPAHRTATVDPSALRCRIRRKPSGHPP